ncbi:MarR family transcriptional regulator [Bacteroides gallinaceum]|uniref:MarR family winged helix-turn-helix transcriptional regulator n=1 Tax=Bacteroides gallinaceum TaxID=1462571 RepID=UPI0015AC5674|nr:MarR family transcriptional regulator [Bacteroides gallinaceum]MDM8153676.1 MarR family transcriptional regulator [Bacteroides gallinaceum]
MEKESAAFRELMLQLFRTRMTFRRTVQQALKKMEAGITFEMLQVLRCLWEEQGISQQVLAERIAKGKAALSNLIMNLEKKNYVCRQEDESDRRNKRVFLTAEGAVFYERINATLDDIYASAGMALGVEKTRGIVSDLKLTCDVLEGI